jgi:hypothetical protein
MARISQNVGSNELQRIQAMNSDASYRLHDGCQNVRVVAAAANVLAQGSADPLTRCARMVAAESDGSHDVPRHAVAALKRLLIDKRLLHDM